MNSLISDGFEPTTKFATSSEGKTKMALWVSWDEFHPGYCDDYHFLRQDANGYWSHKQASAYAKNLDDNGALIADPEYAYLLNYDQFIGYFWAPSNSTETAGWATIQ